MRLRVIKTADHPCLEKESRGHIGCHTPEVGFRYAAVKVAQYEIVAGVVESASDITPGKIRIAAIAARATRPSFRPAGKKRKAHQENECQEGHLFAAYAS
jgi:hypothetical protein